MLTKIEKDGVYNCCFIRGIACLFFSFACRCCADDVYVHVHRYHREELSYLSVLLYRLGM
jgi:hypothetical protein